jgi:acyl dehydratase
MPITEAHAGRRYPPTSPYEVSAAKVAEFAGALGDENPAYQGERPIAPPTFVAVIAAQAWDAMFADPELDLALPRVIHADQRFSYLRPMRAGDRVRATLSIDRVRSREKVDIITLSVRVEDLDGDEFCTATTTFFHSHQPPAADAEA